MIGYCDTCSYDPSEKASWKVLPKSESTIPDPETDKLALETARALDDHRSSTAVKQILRTKEILDMFLDLLGYNELKVPGVDKNAKLNFFVQQAENTHAPLFRSFLHLKFPHYNPPSLPPKDSPPQRTVTLGFPKSKTTANADNRYTHVITPIRSTAILNLFSPHTRCQLLISKKRPRMLVADAIGLLIYLESHELWYICEAFHWGSPSMPWWATPRGEQQVRTLRFVVRWLAGLGPDEKIPEGMGQDSRPMWGRIQWLKGLNEKDMAKYKRGSAGWEGWRWLMALHEGVKANPNREVKG